MFFFSVIGAIQMRYDDDDDERHVQQVRSVVRSESLTCSLTPPALIVTGYKRSIVKHFCSQYISISINFHLACSAIKVLRK